MKKFIINENEKKEILFLYGLLKESVDSEVKDYLDFYLAGRSCSQIANDIEGFKNTPEFDKLTREEKNNINKAIIGLNNPALGVGFGNIPCERGKDKCQCLKEYMKQELVKKLATDPQAVTIQACNFSKNYPPPKPLSFCQTQPINQSQPTVQTHQPIQTPPQNQTTSQPQTFTPQPPTVDEKPKYDDYFEKIKKPEQKSQTGYKFKGL